ncbi:hypothetical protein F3Y22_tig00111366pilonHSYRG00164 [Hibiscus syriacus]|uniref:Uncharacterized protein n=1 Tax=Hibiscus syriacus TaxID=106335 RepID=A0A6A2YNB6_HIBSY|nr:hypothetical protein F3Y22_tig00111366pilonHSYRG00164 [Hibiscus syriacus]
MEMLTICSASRHPNFSSLFISRSLISDSLQASIFPPKFHPLRRPMPFRLRSNPTTRPPRSISAVSRPPSPPDSDPPVCTGIDMAFVNKPGNFTTLDIFRSYLSFPVVSGKDDHISGSCADLLCCSFLDVSVLLVLCMGRDEFW